MLNEYRLPLSHFFSPRTDFTDEPTDYPVITTKWLEELNRIIGQVRRAYLPHLNILDVDRRIKAWVENDHHGMAHSYFTYKGARFLAEEEGEIVDERLDPVLQAGAVLHDLYQFIRLNRHTVLVI